MEFFDKLGKKASETYKVTAEKTGKLAKEAKLRLKMNENKAEIQEIYKEIGKKVYEKHIREEEINIKQELLEECTKIDVLSAEIENCLKDVLALKDKRKCEKCSSEIDKNAQFCPQCGAKQEPIQEEEAKEVEVLDNSNDEQTTTIEENNEKVNTSEQEANYETIEKSEESVTEQKVEEGNAIEESAESDITEKNETEKNKTQENKKEENITEEDIESNDTSENN